MKKLIIASMLAVFTVGCYAGGDAPKDAPKTKMVCKDAKDKNGKVIKNKDGTVRQSCKEIKVHKKLEGTKVPEKKK